MFLRWLLTKFPGEMRHGWRLVRRDLLLWSAIAAAMVASPFVSASQQLPVSPLTGRLFADLAGTFVVAILQPMLFAAAAADQAWSWRQLGDVFVRRAVATVYFLSVAVTMSYGAGALIMAGVYTMLDQTPVRPYAAIVVSVVVTVTLLTRFCFVLFLAVLESRESIEGDSPPEGFVSGVVSLLAWPLVASSRMTKDIRWSLAPYVVLSIAAPLPAVFTPPLIRLPLVVALLLVSFTAMAVLFDYYRQCLAQLATNDKTSRPGR